MKTIIQLDCCSLLPLSFSDHVGVLLLFRRGAHTSDWGLRSVAIAERCNRSFRSQIHTQSLSLPCTRVLAQLPAHSAIHPQCFVCLLAYWFPISLDISSLHHHISLPSPACTFHTHTLAPDGAAASLLIARCFRLVKLPSS